MIMQGSVLGFLTIAMLNEMWKKYQKGQYIWGDKYISDGLAKDHEEKSRREWMNKIVNLFVMWLVNMNSKLSKKNLITRETSFRFSSMFENAMFEIIEN